MKRQRTDTASGAVAAMKDAVEVPTPDHIAEKLNAVGRIQWRIITGSKAASLWTDNDLELAGELAIARQDREKYRALRVEIDDDIDEHPYKRLQGLAECDKQVEVLIKRDERLTRLLQIHPEATVGKARDQVKKNTAAREAKSTVDGLGGDSLIAQPMH